MVIALRKKSSLGNQAARNLYALTRNLCLADQAARNLFVLERNLTLQPINVENEILGNHG